MRRDIFKILLPDDLDTDMQRLCQHAIMQAEEHSMEYFTPCTWTATFEGNCGSELMFRVERVHA